MSEIEELEAAIAALESQRQLLGEAVVDTALRPLRQRLHEVMAASRSETMKLVTVVFSDVVGFTAMSERLDPEDVRRLMAGYFETWTETVERHGGVVEKFIGDAVLAVFGLPTAREDDAERAVRAAWEVVGKGTDGFEMRVGVNTGRALVSTLDERRGELVVVGDVVNTASRLQGAAPPGGVLLSDETWRLSRHAFVARPQPPLVVKGKRDPLRTYVVDRPKPRALRLTATDVTAPLLGREAERAELLAAVDRVTADHAGLHTVLISGEVGIGKTRLLAELDADLDRDPRPFIYLRGRAAPSTASQAGALWRDVVASRFDVAADDPLDRALAKLSGGIAAVVSLSPEEIEAVEVTLGLRRLPTGSDAEATRFVGIRAVARLLHEYARRGPVVILLEDLHWADAASLDVMAEVLARVATDRVLVVATTRPEWFEGTARWTDAGRLDVLRLDPLDASDIVGVVGRMIDTDAPHEVIEAIADAADGNPFYAEELARMLQETAAADASVAAGGGWADLLAKVPTTLIGVLQARLDALDIEERRLLQRSSVVGRVFWSAPVERMDVTAVDRRLASLTRRDLVRRQHPSAFVTTSEHAFKHALVRQVAYDTLLASERRRFHAIVAEWLAEITAGAAREDDYAAVIAEHYERAGRPAPAATWYRRAGDAAAAQFANGDALRNYAGAARLQAEANAPAEERLAVLLDLERLHDLAADRDDQRAVLDRAEAPAGEIGARARVTVLLRRSELAIAEARYDEATALAQAALDLLDEASDAALVAEAEFCLGRISFSLAQLGVAETHLSRAVDAARQLGLDRLEADATRYLGLVLDGRADYGRSADAFGRALELATRVRDRRLQAMCHNSLGVGLLNAGEVAAAERQLREALRIREEIGDFVGASASRHNIAVLLFERGELPAARAEFAREFELCRATGERNGEAAALLGVGAAAALMGDHAAARDALAESCVLLDRLGDDPGLSEATTYLGHVDRVEGRYDEARRRLSEAEALAAREGFDRDRSFALGELARVELDEGRPQAARELAELAAALAGNDADCAITADAAHALAIASTSDPESAVAVVDRLLDRLGSSETSAGPRAFAWAACATVLEGVGDASTAATLARRGYDEVVARAATFDADDARRYLEHVPDHAALGALADRLDPRS
jgi:class 3 adenylate cyclase/tetratricopeptide (TPR) repeat protein